ncbi:MAG: hypothetical protein NZ750_13380 [Anaerolineae bacterium]|nr:hypothetical protein [Anaerolineae bacterium]MDW8172791.1 hypothetical protein [Anaerolineae bacterium]
MDDFGQFIGQLPPILYVMACGPLVLLFTYLSLRSTLRRSKSPTVNAPSAGGLAALQAARQAADEADMPDLDLLVDLADKPAAPRPAGPRQLSDSPIPVRLAQGALVQAKELIAILRDERDGRLMVQVGSYGYRSLADAPEAKREFTRIMKELSGIIMQPDDNPPQTQPASAAPTVPQPTSDPDTSPHDLSEKPASPARQTTERQQATIPPAANPAPDVPRGTLPGDLPSYRFDDNPAVIQRNRFGGVKKVEFEAPPPIDIASAIESYLQFKISQTPAMQGQRIHIRPSISGGVRIVVGDSSYDFVDEIPDVEVRTFIQTTIAEWQARN